MFPPAFPGYPLALKIFVLPNGQEGEKIPVAKAIDREQVALIVNDVISMRTAKPYAKSNRPTLIGSGRNSFTGMMTDDW